MGIALEPGLDKLFTSQQIFRLLLDTMARPGKVVALKALQFTPPEGLTGSIAGLAFTLLDRETSFTVLPACESWSQYLSLNTGSQSTGVSAAEFVIMDGRTDLPELAGAKRGNLLFPDRGATLMVMVSAIEEGGASGMKIGLQGPGVSGARSLSVSGLYAANLERVIDLNREFPLGVDLILSDNQGRLAAIPRSCSIIREVHD